MSRGIYGHEDKFLCGFKFAMILVTGGGKWELMNDAVRPTILERNLIDLVLVGTSRSKFKIIPRFLHLPMIPTPAA